MKNVVGFVLFLILGVNPAAAEVSFMLRCESFLFGLGVSRVPLVQQIYGGRLQRVVNAYFGPDESLSNDEVQLFLEFLGETPFHPVEYIEFLEGYRGPKDHRTEQVRSALRFVRWAKGPDKESGKKAIQEEIARSEVARVVMEMWDVLEAAGYSIKLTPGTLGVELPDPDRLVFSVDPSLFISKPWHSVFFEAIFGHYLSQVRRSSDSFESWARKELETRFPDFPLSDEAIDSFGVVVSILVANREKMFLSGSITSRLRQESPGFHDQRSSREAMNAPRFDVGKAREVVLAVMTVGMDGVEGDDWASRLAREYSTLSLFDYLDAAGLDSPPLRTILSWTE